ncbi:transmembrane protein 79-like [Antedon mediterranea]|uniref:transmembrane protein 79-like n=1 Tax=Antedon mediterranea TaxID=105859 RepID=UPI003AF645D6
MSPKKDTQSGIIQDGIIALILFSVYSYIGWNYLPIETTGLDSVFDRLIFTARWQVLEVVLLFTMIMVVANTRFRSVDKIGDPTKPMPPSHIITVHIRVLQNTVEQLALRAPFELILSTYLEQTSMKLIPLLVTFFVVARIIFWVGYTRGPFQRALGFSMTFMPTMLMMFFNLYCFFTKGATFGLSSA